MDFRTVLPTSAPSRRLLYQTLPKARGFHPSSPGLQSRGQAGLGARGRCRYLRGGGAVPLPGAAGLVVLPPAAALRQLPVRVIVVEGVEQPAAVLPLSPVVLARPRRLRTDMAGLSWVPPRLSPVALPAPPGPAPLTRQEPPVPAMLRPRQWPPRLQQRPRPQPMASGGTKRPRARQPMAARLPARDQRSAQPAGGAGCAAAPPGSGRNHHTGRGWEPQLLLGRSGGRRVHRARPPAGHRAHTIHPHRSEVAPGSAAGFLPSLHEPRDCYTTL